MMKTGVDRKRCNRIAGTYACMHPKKGRILEVGVGTGKNLPCCYEDHRILAIDVSENMLRRAKNRAGIQRARILSRG